MDSKKSRLYAAAGFLGGTLAFAMLFRRGRTADATAMLLAGFICAAVLLYLPLQRQKESAQRRREELVRDYSPLLTMLSLYMTAGLSLRSSWEKMVRNYEEECRKGAAPRPAFEEMRTAWQEIRGGEYEDRAYGSFGRRCGTTEYLRLGGLLETYVQHGNKELLKQLEQEAAASLTVSLQTVREKGERTGTKLLLPILLLFGLSLIIVMVPALMSMQSQL